MLAGVFRDDLEDDPGESQPIAALLRRDRGDLAEDLQAGAEILVPEGGVRVGTQGRGRRVDRPCLALDLGLELDRGIGEIVAPEGLFGGLRRSEAKRQHCANRRGTNKTDHDGAPWGRERTPFRQKECEKVTG